MNKKIRQLLLSMKIGQDREDAEAKARQLFHSFGTEAFGAILDLGWDSLKGGLRENRELLRAISFTVAFFMTREKTAAPSEQHAHAVDLLIKLAALGFNSAKNGLNHLGVTPKEIWQRHLLALPVMEGHSNDREVSLKEALIEIELSRNLEGSKGVLGDHYSLGKDARHRFGLYRTGGKRFAVRSTKL